MITLYSYTIIADLTLLAVVIAIFIFAVSIYKGASELSIKEKESASNRSKEIITIRKTEVNKKLKTLTNGASLNEVRAELDKLDNEIHNIDKSVLKIINKANCLTARNLVFVPGSLLIASIIGSGIAIATSGTFQTMMWVLSLLLLASSLYFICRCICAIEFFSNSIDLSTLMEQALDRQANKTIPIIELDIFDFELEITHGETKEIHPALFLKQGLTAKNVNIRFSGTEELDFQDETVEQLEFDNLQMKKPKQFWYKIGDLNYAVYHSVDFKVKAPDTPGKYLMSYWIQCENFTSKEETFTIKVT